jgi:hypothetical protein
MRGTLGKALVPGLLLAALAWAPSANAAGWAAPASTIYAGGGSVSSVRDSTAAEDQAGNAYAAWFDLKTGNAYMSERPAGGSFPALPQVLAHASFDVLPQIAVDASGNVIVVWIEGGVLHGVQQAPGGSFQPLTLPATSSAQSVQIAAGGDGTVIIAWQQNNQVMYTLRRSGGSFGPPASVPNSSNIYLFSIAADGTGDIGVGLITRTGAPGSDVTSVYGGYWDHNGSGFNVSGTALDTQTSSSGAMRSIANIKLVMGPGGDAIATWTRSCSSSTTQCSPSSPSTSSALYESIRKAGPATSFPLGTSIASSTAGAFAFFTTASAFDTSGNVVVAWGLSAGGVSEVDQSQAAAATGAFTAPATVASAVGGNPYVAMGSLASGQIVLVYTTYDSGTSTNQVWGTLRPTGPTGTAFNAATQISAISGSSIDQSPGLSLAPQGNDAFVDWSLYTHPGVQGVGYSGNPPRVTVSTPATATVGESIAVSASAVGIWTPASVGRIDFGDGSTPGSGASATHTYAAPGPYTITATATDGAGNTGNGTAQVVVSAPGGGSGGGGAGGGDTTPPVLSSLKLTPTAFRPARSGPSMAQVKTGTTVSYKVTEASAATFKVERAVPGRKRGHRCVKPSPKTRRGKRCTRFVLVRGSFRRSNVVGANRFRFTGRIAGAALKPGNYRLDAIPKDTAGNVGRTVRSQFRVVR